MTKHGTMTEQGDDDRAEDVDRAGGTMTEQGDDDKAGDDDRAGG